MKVLITDLAHSAYALPKTDVGSFDGRSDDKGAEPEGLTMAEIDGRFVRKALTISALNKSCSAGKPTVHPGGTEAHNSLSIWGASQRGCTRKPNIVLFCYFPMAYLVKLLAPLRSIVSVCPSHVSVALIFSWCLQDVRVRFLGEDRRMDVLGCV